MNFCKNGLKSQKSRRIRKGQSGNAMVYVLIALGLMGLLTASLMRQDNAGSDTVSQEQAEFQAMQILEYVTASQNAIDQMVMTGTNPNDLDFTLPAATSFNTAPHLNKLFHPHGGGLIYKEPSTPPFVDNSTTPKQGWYFTKRTNVDWTPTTGADIILTARSINLAVCQALNKKITGNAAVVNVESSADLTEIFTDHGSAMNLTTTNCPNCEGHAQLCVKGSAENPDFYTIILGK